MTEKAPAQIAAEEQQDTPWCVCSICNEPIIIFNMRIFPTCQCENRQIVLTPKGIRRIVLTPEGIRRGDYAV